MMTSISSCFKCHCHNLPQLSTSCPALPYLCYFLVLQVPNVTSIHSYFSILRPHFARTSPRPKDLHSSPFPGASGSTKSPQISPSPATLWVLIVLNSPSWQDKGIENVLSVPKTWQRPSADWMVIKRGESICLQ